MKKLISILTLACFTQASAITYHTQIAGWDGNGDFVTYNRDNVVSGRGVVTVNATTHLDEVLSLSSLFSLVAFSGDYNDLTNKPAAPAALSFSNPIRTLNSAFQPSTTRNALVSYSVDIACTATLIGGQTGTVFLEYADDSAFTTNVVEVGRFVNGNSVSLAIAITVNQTNTGTLTGIIPANKYVRLRTANTVGTPTFNYRSGQEVLL